MFNLSQLWTTVVTVTLLFIVGCSDNSRYALKDDEAPKKPLSVEHLEDAKPRYEPYSLGGNKDYKLLGESYQIISEPKGYTASGKASWYGSKFHGHLTSNGEVYDMYSMTAAHKTLPLPSYVKVNNTDNQKTVIVRVNDRGPFHEDRILDLSYAAAYKLDILDSGTGNIKLEVITIERSPEDDAEYPKFIIQVASTSSQESAKQVANDLAKKLNTSAFIEENNGFHRIMLGPYIKQKEAKNMQKELDKLGFHGSFLKTTKK